MGGGFQFENPNPVMGQMTFPKPLLKVIEATMLVQWWPLTERNC